MLRRYRTYLRNIFFSLCYLDTKCIPVTYRIEPKVSHDADARAVTIEDLQAKQARLKDLYVDDLI